MIDVPDNSTTITSLLGGGALVAWIRERRKGKKDANMFALEFLKQQSERIDKLVQQVAALEADHRVALEALQIAREETHALRNELFKAKATIELRDHEIARLKTALAEHGRGVA